MANNPRWELVRRPDWGLAGRTYAEDKFIPQYLIRFRAPNGRVMVESPRRYNSRRAAKNALHQVNTIFREDVVERDER